MPINPYSLLSEQERLRGNALDEDSIFLSPEGMEYFYASGTPILLPRVAENWPALRWTPEYLISHLGDPLIHAQTSRDHDPNYELNKSAHTTSFLLSEFLSRLRHGNDTYLTAYNASANAEAFAPLWKDTRPKLYYLTSPEGFPWIGGANTFTPLHFDLTNNLIVQVVGAKNFWLAPPSLTPKLRNDVSVFSSIHDIDSPRGTCDALPEDFYRVRLLPGDALFIPFGWWHQVRSLSFSVTITYTNFIWPNDMASRIGVT